MLLFDAQGQRELVRALGLPPTTDATGLVNGLGQRFGSYFEIRQFADTEHVLYEQRVDLDP